MRLTNAALAELLSREAERHSDERQRALRRASRAAIWVWTEEAAAVRETDRPLTVLPRVGPWIARLMETWMAAEVPPPEPPRIRAGFLTLTEARATVDAHPEWRAAYRGDLQVHTTWSDGAGSLEAMVAAAARRGYRYVGITDHSKGLAIAHGMNEETLRRQWRAMDALSEGGIDIVRSIEMNLSPSGEGDMDDDVLDRLDLVVAAFHSRLRVKEDETDRYLRAIENPRVHILAHPRGRVYDVRTGLSADWERVASAAAERDLALEIDAWPNRQDLDGDALRAVAAGGGRVAIDTDAHAIDELGYVEFGLALAIRAGIPMDRVVNFLSHDQLLAWARGSSRMARRGVTATSARSARAAPAAPPP